MNKFISAVPPYHHPVGINFKDAAYRAWVSLGGSTALAHYPWRWLHHWAFHHELPRMATRRGEARLRFVEPMSVLFDTFPDYARYEVVPLVWDCWPKYYDSMLDWVREHQVKSIIFTSSQTAEVFRNSLHGINILALTEGIDISPYKVGNPLKEREIDLLEYGSIKRNFFHHYVDGIKHINRENSNGILHSFDNLTSTLSNSKVVIALPRCDTEPEVAQGVETLTQRFWEGMLSRCVLLGRAPRELIDLVGYNPVITLNRENADVQVREIVNHIDEYQPLVDHNRKTALRLAPWQVRMKRIMNWLESLGYQCRKENHG